MSHEYISLQDIDVKSTFVGAKAEKLAVLVHAGIAVPKGVVVSESNALVHHDDLAWFEQVTEGLLFPLLVRSSSNIEDAPLASFAGQFLSVGPIDTSRDLLRAVHDVIAHKKSKVLQAYLSHYNIADDSLNVHLLLQEYVRPVYSGVMFTPANADVDTYIIEYTRGGEGVTSGSSKVNQITINARTNAIENHRANGDELSVEAIVELTNYVAKIVTLFEGPQDIEWVHDGKKIHIVQTRPVTVALQAQDKIIEEEKERVLNLFGNNIPVLSAHEFSEGIGRATPLTTSIFQHIYAPDGPWKRVLKKYGYSVPVYDPTTFIVEVFGRLYLNKDVEQKLLYDQLPFSYDVQASVRKWVTSPVVYLRTAPAFLLYILGSVRVRLGTYLFIKKEKQILLNLTQKIEREKIITDMTPEQHLKLILNDILPLLFQISLYQQNVRTHIERMVGSYLSDTEKVQVLRSGVSDSLTMILVDTHLTDAEKKEKLGGRGYYELEVASERFEDREGFLDSLITGSHPRQKHICDVADLREKVISGFQSTFDKQVLTTYFEMHDRLAQAREDVHTVWVSEIADMRTTLLQIDRERELYNHIWYFTLEELGNSLDTNVLIDRKMRYLAVKTVPVPGYIDGQIWDTVGVPFARANKLNAVQGEGLSPGVAKGTVGSLEDITNGKSVDILLTPDLDPALTVVYSKIQGIVAETGGLLSHAVIIAREYGVPVVVLKDASELLTQNDTVSIDGATGRIET